MNEFLKPYPEEEAPILPVLEDPLAARRRRRLLFDGTDHGTKGNNGGRKFVELPRKSPWGQSIAVPLDELQRKAIEKMRSKGKKEAKLGLEDYFADSGPDFREAD